MLLKDQYALITGASRGIGKATARELASHGAHLILLSRDGTLLSETKREIHAKYDCKIHNYEVDIRDKDKLKEIFKDIHSKGIQIDTLVNNAGVMEDATLLMIKEETIEHIYDTNVFGMITVTKLAMKSFLRKRSGSIINMSSIIGRNGNKAQTIYGSSKAAVIGFTKSLSKELAPLNVRVNAIAPGFIDTDMTRNMNEEYRNKNLESIGMGRIGSPEDVAKVVVFLASDLSKYVTGQVIGVDGGMVI